MRARARLARSKSSRLRSASPHRTSSRCSVSQRAQSDLAARRDLAHRRLDYAADAFRSHERGAARSGSCAPARSCVQCSDRKRRGAQDIRECQTARPASWSRKSRSRTARTPQPTSRPPTCPTPCAGCTGREERARGFLEERNGLISERAEPGRGDHQGFRRGSPARPRRCRRFASELRAQRSIARGSETEPQGTSRTQSDSPDETAVLTARDIPTLRAPRPRRFAVPPIAESPCEAASTAAIDAASGGAGLPDQRVNGPDDARGTALRDDHSDGLAPLRLCFGVLMAAAHQREYSHRSGPVTRQLHEVRSEPRLHVCSRFT